MYGCQIFVLLAVVVSSLAFPNASCESTKKLAELVVQQIPSLTKAHHSCEFGFAASYLLEKLQIANVTRRLPSLIRVLDRKGKTVLLTTYKKCKSERYCVKSLLGKGKERNRIVKSIERQSKGANSFGCDLWKQKRRSALFCIFSPKIVEYDDHYFLYNGSYYDYSVEDPNADFPEY